MVKKPSGSGNADLATNDDVKKVEKAFAKEFAKEVEKAFAKEREEFAKEREEFVIKPLKKIEKRRFELAKTR